MLINRRRLLVPLVLGVAIAAVLVPVLISSSRPLSKSTSDHHAPSSPAIGGEVQGPDPRRVGTPYSSAAQSGAAAKHPVPTCGDQSTLYNMPDGSVVGYFKSSDAVLSVPPPGSYVAGPITGNSVVKPQQLTVKGLPAWGFQNDRGIVAVDSAGRREGSTVRSLLTWNEGSTALELTSPSQLTLSDLVSLANNCS